MPPEELGIRLKDAGRFVRAKATPSAASEVLSFEYQDITVKMIKVNPWSLLQFANLQGWEGRLSCDTEHHRGIIGETIEQTVDS